MLCFDFASRKLSIARNSLIESLFSVKCVKNFVKKFILHPHYQILTLNKMPSLLILEKKLVSLKWKHGNGHFQLTEKPSYKTDNNIITFVPQPHT
mgnify:CR=1 FL=1